MTARRPSLVTMLIVLLLLGGAEAAARRAEPSLEPFVTWGNEETDAKIPQIEALERDGGVDVVFLGSSIANVGFDPSQFIEESPWATSAYNASIDSASPQLLEQWTIDVVLPALRPKVIVVGVTSRSFNDNGRNQAIAYQAYFDSPGRQLRIGEANPIERITASVNESSALARIKSSLRRPTAFGADPPKELMLTDLGHERRRADDRYNFTARYRKRMKRSVLNDFEVGGLQVESLRGLVAAAEAAGARVVLVDMPVFERDHFAVHPNGAADFAAYRALIDEFAAENPVDLLMPPNTPWRRGIFADPIHLSGNGTERLTRWLARTLNVSG